jgi:flagellar biosynthesis/type III secretory pathway M-ring protein FliF/YscJ
MATKKNEALAAQNTGFLALANADLGAMMAEELDGLDAGFERIKIPSAGSTLFEMPGEDGDPELAKEKAIAELELKAKAETIDQLEKFIDKNPNAVAQLLRNWLSEE